MIYKISKNYKNSNFVFYNRLKKYSCSGKQGQSKNFLQIFTLLDFILYCIVTINRYLSIYVQLVKILTAKQLFFRLN